MRRLWTVVALSLVVSAGAFTVSRSADTQPAQVRKRNKKPRGRKLDRLRERVLKKKVGLSDEKVEQVTALFKQQQQERRTLEKKLHGSRKALGKLFRSDSDDQDAYRQSMTDMRETTRQLASLRERQLDDLGKILTPKEQAKLLRAMEKVQRRFQRRRHRRR